MSWWPWKRRRNLPQEIRRLGPPNFTAMMNAIGDMLDRERTDDGSERDLLLNEALDLLKRAARMGP